MSDGVGRNEIRSTGEALPERSAFDPAQAAVPPGAMLPLARALRPLVEVALPDRVRLRQQLEQRLVHGAATPLALLDLELESDDDAPGAHALERVLALRLLHALRADDVVGRMGAGCFVCLLSGVPSRYALERVAERLRAVIEMPLDLGPRRAQVRAHIGIAVCPRDGATAGVLLKHADEAAFRARAHRAGHAFFDPRLDP